MITQQITAIALRLLSIWLLIQLVLNLPSLIILLTGVEQYRQQEISTSVYLAFISLSTLVGIVAAFLINKAATSVLVRAKTESKVTLSSVSQKILFQIAGLYFVVNAIAYLPRSLSFIPNAVELSLSNLLFPAGLVFQLIIGLWLISYSTFWCNFFNKLRGRT
jgi:hypothetical protein